MQASLERPKCRHSRYESVALLIAEFPFHACMDYVVLHADSAQTLSDGSANPIQACALGLYFFYFFFSFLARPDSEQPPSDPQPNNNVYTRSCVCVCVSDMVVVSRRDSQSSFALCLVCVDVFCVFFPTAGPVQAVTQRRPRQQVRADLLSALASLLLRPPANATKGTDAAAAAEDPNTQQQQHNNDDKRSQQGVNQGRRRWSQRRRHPPTPRLVHTHRTSREQRASTKAALFLRRERPRLGFSDNISE